METISANQLRQTISVKHKNGLSVSHRTLSDRQRNDMATFKRFFPSEKEAIAFFAPAKWEEALHHVEKCTLCANATLRVMEEFYLTGTAKIMVCNNLIGIYSVAKPSESINRETIDRAAQLFVGKYGTDITPFGMLYYFANYLLEYKNSYSPFDLQDVLRQCGKVFMPWWQSRLARINTPKAEQGVKETGTAALYSYLRREYVAKGRDIRESALYQYGRITEEECAKITNALSPSN